MINPDFALLIKTVKALHKRIVKVENHVKAKDAAIARKSKTILRLYNRYYAQTVRRVESDDKKSKAMEEFSRKLNQWRRSMGSMRRLGRILGAVERDKILITLTPGEFAKFKRWLNMDFRRK